MIEVRHIQNGFKIGAFFWLHEFQCRCRERGYSIYDGYCGGAVEIHPQLVHALDQIRNKFDYTHIESGYRCWNYHANHIYGSRKREPTKNSSHLSGLAADFWTQEAMRYPDQKDFLVDIGVTGIGYRKDTGRIIHVDIGHSDVTIWKY